MHNIKELRKNPEEYKIKFKERNVTFDTERFILLDKNNRDLIYKKETLEQEKKLLSKSKDKNNHEKSKKISEQINKLSIEQSKIQKDLNQILFNLPNIACDEVPKGKDENQNKLIKKEGTLKEFKFSSLSSSDGSIILKLFSITVLVVLLILCSCVKSEK